MAVGDAVAGASVLGVGVGVHAPQKCWGLQLAQLLLCVWGQLSLCVRGWLLLLLLLRV